MTHKLPTFTVGMGLNVFTLRPYDELRLFFDTSSHINKTPSLSKN